MEKKVEKTFNVIVLGVIFDPKKKMILIGKREKDKYIKDLVWAFPGGRPEYGEEIDETLKKKIKLKTGLKVEDLGSVFARTHKENPGFLLMYHLCEVVGGKEKPMGEFKELKWVKPEELETHFTTSFHPHLKEYILNLK